MWIEATELGVALCTMFWSGNRFLGQFRGLNTVRDLRDALNKIAADTAFSPHAREADVVLDFLNYSELIMPPLRSRLVNRLILMIGSVIFLAAVPVVLVDNGVVTNETKTWVIEIVFALSQVGVGLATGRFFQPEESDFLRNSASLHDRFYDAYVLPAMHVFNNGVRRAEILGLTRVASRQEGMKIEQFVLDTLRRVRILGRAQVAGREQSMKIPPFLQDILQRSARLQGSLDESKGSS